MEEMDILEIVGSRKDCKFIIVAKDVAAGLKLQEKLKLHDIFSTLSIQTIETRQYCLLTNTNCDDSALLKLMVKVKDSDNFKEYEFKNDDDAYIMQYVRREI